MNETIQSDGSTNGDKSQKPAITKVPAETHRKLDRTQRISGLNDLHNFINSETDYSSDGLEKENHNELRISCGSEGRRQALEHQLSENIYFDYGKADIEDAEIVKVAKVNPFESHTDHIEAPVETVGGAEEVRLKRTIVKEFFDLIETGAVEGEEELKYNKQIFVEHAIQLYQMGVLKLDFEVVE